MRARQFIAELKARGVVRVAAIYGAGAWALLQVADVFVPILGLPDTAVSLVLLIAAAGFPFALIMAWWFDLTPGGIVSAPPTAAKVQRVRLSLVQVLELALILALVLTVGYLYLDRLTAADGGASSVPAKAPDRPSIAVMPFVSLSEQEEVRYLGDGLAEEILNLLSRLSELNVVARRSSFSFRGKDATVSEVAKQLAVGHILEGSVRNDGKRLRVTAQLIETDSGFQVWSGSYDREFGQLLQVQDDIARNVVGALQLVLSSTSRASLSRDYDVAPGAYEFYLRGRDYLRRQVDSKNLESAVSLFRQALARDPEFPDALAGLCEALLGLYEQSLKAGHFREAERACQQALALDRSAVQVYIALGNLFRVSGLNDRALLKFTEALELNPYAVDAYIGRGRTLAGINRVEAAREDFRTAIELQPDFWRAHNHMGLSFVRAGDFEQAIPYLERAVKMSPDSVAVLNNLGVAYYMLGRFDKATSSWQRSVDLSPSAASLSNLGASLFFSGKFKEAVDKYRAASALAPENFFYWGNVAEALYFGRGAENEVRQALQEGVRLAEEHLTINPGDKLTQAFLASLEARLGNEESARAHLQSASVLPSDGSAMYIQYHRAVALYTLGELEQALNALELALEFGYPRRLLAVDANFARLRHLPRFQTLSSVER